jgi:hypothetical protein
MVTKPTVEAPDAEPWRETQRMRQSWWVMTAVAAITLSTWLTFLVQILLNLPFGTQPASDLTVWLLWLGFGIAFPLLVWHMRLTVEVSPEAILIHYLPLIERSIPLSEIRAVRARQYSPLLEYGGWGIRGWWRGRTIYSVSGNQCVEIELKSGRSVAIGSQRAGELAAAVQQRRGA